MNLKCFTDNLHNGNFLEEIYGTGENGYGEALSVKWCRCCGAVVVDNEVDGRRMGGSKMQFSDLARMRGSLQAT